MDEDVYRTPKSDLGWAEVKRGSAVKAILIATLVDITATTLLGVAISVVYGVMLALSGDSQELITLKLSDADLTSSIILAGMVSGCLVTIFTGYLCAKLASHSEYKVVTIFAVILMMFGLVMGLSYSFAESVILSLVTLCCAYFGAWLYVSKKGRQAQS